MLNNNMSYLRWAFGIICKNDTYFDVSLYNTIIDKVYNSRSIKDIFDPYTF